MSRLLALLLALLLVPATLAHAEPAAEKREPAAAYLYGFGLDEPDPGLVVFGVIGPQGLRCVYVEAGEAEGQFVANVYCEGSKKTRTGAKAKLIMLSGLEGAEQATDRCTEARKVRKDGVELSCAVEIPLAGAEAEALRSGHPLPGWARKVAR